MTQTVRTRLRVEPLEAGSVWRIVLDAPAGNVLDTPMLESLRHTFAEAGTTPGLKALLIAGMGAHFSFGASVAEHLPDRAAAMLRSFHGMLRAFAGARVVTMAAVRGQCLGGGLELASFCSRVFAAADARLGQPEIRLGVFAPAASLVLPERIGQAAAEDLCLSGRTVDAAEALALRLVDEVAQDPEARALEWFRANLAPHSAASLRHAVAAVRHGMVQRVLRGLETLETLYLEDLMATDDAAEGIRAFLEKRKPRWVDS